MGILSTQAKQPRYDIDSLERSLQYVTVQTIPSQSNYNINKINNIGNSNNIKNDIHSNSKNIPRRSSIYDNEQEPSNSNNYINSSIDDKQIKTSPLNNMYDHIDPVTLSNNYFPKKDDVLNNMRSKLKVSYMNFTIMFYIIYIYI